MVLFHILWKKEKYKQNNLNYDTINKIIQVLRGILFGGIVVMAKRMTEDEVRDLARKTLGLVDKDGVRSGVGQLTTFNQLGFIGISDKPDGWYLPNNRSDVALVLETKASHIPLGEKQVAEVLKNIEIVESQYKKVIGILYNGEDIRVFKNQEEVNTVNQLQQTGYYVSLFTSDAIDKEKIYELTARIIVNDIIKSTLT